ncbi:MAG: glycosyl hydrolase, partial [Bacteroidota bacterium]
FAQKKKKDNKKEEKKEHYLDEVGLSALKFRNVGPAITSGRIADLAVHPDNRAVYYVATASGGVWKTTNAGTTYQPIFDSQGSYSIGCITLDPNNPNTIWVGTGENNNQRSVAYGDGLYRSDDGGASWQHMGLKNSEHIGKIIVHPDNSDVIYVAAIGPLWSEGGDRGLYKSTDGGQNWEAILTVDKHTGVNDVVMDPRDPAVLYASTYQRRRHVFTYVGGGPGSGLHKSTDGGKTWKKINKGLPGVDKGRIGLAISPADPEIIYAIVEAAQRKGGFYRSTNRGASWQKRSGYSTSGNYYSEIVAHPTDPDIVYAMDTWMHWTTDGGKTFTQVNEQYKHVDNHCIWIDPNDTNYYLVGCDGGLYESFDAAGSWVFKANLPVTQFYKVAVDNDAPFYNIYGGTQDNFSMGGPARTRNQHGIMNSDWYITHGGDGFESQIDPNDPNIVYAQSQYGVLFRYDRQSGERIGIQPKPAKEEPQFRWNWDAPLAVSSHKPSRIYFAANKLFRSDDRGNSWTTLSDDLTRQIDRNTLEVMGRIQSIDAVAKNASTSPYGTIVAFSESPLKEDLLYVGTDDGLIQVSDNAGGSWTKVETNLIKGVPGPRTYVNALLASQHNENVVYAAFNHHKYGDFKPYVYKSEDQGKSWTNITANLPERGSVYSIAEDHVDPNLLFIGTEFGCFFSNDGGQHWKKLGAGLPTIAVRDIAIQQRENDLVLGTFGRGFYVLDDYSPLREMSAEALEADGKLFAVKDGLIYIESVPLGLRGNSFQGHAFYTAENPPVGATFTYHIKDSFESLRDKRRKAEKEQIKEGEALRYPTYEELEAENREKSAYLLFQITDMDGNVIRNLKKGVAKGVHRVTWDGRFASISPVSLRSSSFDNPFSNEDVGVLVMPGQYQVSLWQSIDGELAQLDSPQTFELKTLGDVTLPAADRQELVQFQKEAQRLQRAIGGAGRMLGDINNRISHMEQATFSIAGNTVELESMYQAMKEELHAINKNLYGDRVASRLDQQSPFSIAGRIGWLTYEMWNSTSAPTKTQQSALGLASSDFKPVLNQIRAIYETKLPALEKALEKAGAPYTPGRIIEYGRQ